MMEVVKRRRVTLVCLATLLFASISSLYLNLQISGDFGYFAAFSAALIEEEEEMAIGNQALSLCQFRRDAPNFSDFASLSPNHEACDNFYQSDDSSNCSALLPKENHSFNISKGDLLDFRNVLLISHFNLPTFGAVAKVKALYGSVFADILFCGPTYDLDEFLMQTNSRFTNDTLSQVDFNSSIYIAYGTPVRQSSENFYQCLVLADQRKNLLKFDGVLLMSDDMILNIWNLQRNGKSLDKNWMMKGDPEDAFQIDNGRFCYKNNSNNKEDCSRNDLFWVWPHVYKQNLFMFYEHLETLSGYYSEKVKQKFANPLVNNEILEQMTSINVNRLENRDFWQWILAALEVKTGGRRRLLGRASADCFTLQNIAVGTVLRTISKEGDLLTLDTTGHDWGQNRGRPITETYSTNYELVHPVKLSTAQRLNTTTGSPKTCLYCNLLKVTWGYSKLLESPCLLGVGGENRTLKLPLEF